MNVNLNLGECKDELKFSFTVVEIEEKINIVTAEDVERKKVLLSQT
jgi:hypothetical protein